MPQYAFILPDEWTKQQMAWAKSATKDMREDQINRMWQMMHSWGIGQGTYAVDFFSAMRRAIRKVMNNYP